MKIRALYFKLLCVIATMRKDADRRKKIRKLRRIILNDIVTAKIRGLEYLTYELPYNEILSKSQVFDKRKHVAESIAKDYGFRIKESNSKVVIYL
ncbi:MAG: hypothetical protein WCS15_01385 [Prevotella sp.]